ncbi:MAG: hypothetical protein Q7S15_01320 [bacterium]|nr:hypothetical protein [bacterium]
MTTLKWFKVWKTIFLGTAALQVLRQLIIDHFESNGWSITEDLRKILSRTKVSPSQASVDLAAIPLSELGFKAGGAIGDVCKEAQRRGLKLCTHEMGLQLRLQYKDQPRGEWLSVPVTQEGSKGTIDMFTIVNVRHGPRFRANEEKLAQFYHGHAIFVFVLPSQLD